jgi:hypothetical protein
MTYRYMTIANKSDDNAFLHFHLFNRKSIGARIWDIRLKKDAASRDCRSIAASDLHVQLREAPFNILFPPRRTCGCGNSVRCAYAGSSWEESTRYFCFLYANWLSFAA